MIPSLHGTSHSSSRTSATYSFCVGCVTDSASNDFVGAVPVQVDGISTRRHHRLVSLSLCVRRSRVNPPSTFVLYRRKFGPYSYTRPNRPQSKAPERYRRGCHCTSDMGTSGPKRWKCSGDQHIHRFDICPDPFPMSSDPSSEPSLPSVFDGLNRLFWGSFPCTPI